MPISETNINKEKENNDEQQKRWIRSNREKSHSIAIMISFAAFLVPFFALTHFILHLIFYTFSSFLLFISFLCVIFKIIIIFNT